jgi:hypothetical protein
MKYVQVLCLLLTITDFAIASSPEQPFDAKKYAEFAKFMKKFGCPAGFEDDKERVLKPGDIGRVVNATRMKAIIKQHKLTKLGVPKKCLGYVNGFWITAAEKIHNTGNTANKLSLEEIQQLTKFAEKTGFRDWYGNTILTNDGKIVFIDTEDNSFAIGRIHGNPEQGIPMHCKTVYVANVGLFKHWMTPEALVWFKKREETFTNPENLKEDTPLYGNTKYDSSGINFEKAKKEFDEIRKEEWKR